MIELVCRTKEEQQRWISILRDAIFKRPREGESCVYYILFHTQLRNSDET